LSRYKTGAAGDAVTSGAGVGQELLAEFGFQFAFGLGLQFGQASLHLNRGLRGGLFAEDGGGRRRLFFLLACFPLGFAACFTVFAGCHLGGSCSLVIPMKKAGAVINQPFLPAWGGG
jgi:hypothetical protein